jgi:ABC-type Mn2+/Zn2+ transport system permease subunit
LITIATATIGTLLTTAMLIIPAYLGDVRKGGVDRYFLTVILIGISGSVSGFITALIFDLPPAVCAAGGVGITGLIANRLSSNKFRN